MYFNSYKILYYKDLFHILIVRTKCPRNFIDTASIDASSNIFYRLCIDQYNHACFDTNWAVTFPQVTWQNTSFLHSLLLPAAMTLLLYGMRDCGMHCSRTHAQQHKMADDNRTEFKFSDNLGSNVSMHQKDRFFTIQLKKVSFRGHP